MVVIITAFTTLEAALSKKRLLLPLLSWKREGGGEVGEGRGDVLELEIEIEREGGMAFGTTVAGAGVVLDRIELEDKLEVCGSPLKIFHK